MDCVFRTERLRLHEAKAQDAQFFQHLMTTPKWLEFIGDRGVHSKEDARRYIEETIRWSYTKNGYGLYTMVPTGELAPIGICGFLKRDYLAHPDVGFAILPSHEGRGYIKEALAGLFKFGSEQLGFSTLHALIAFNNNASESLVTQFGFTYERDVISPNSSERLRLFTAKFIK